jgi:hypothetical protein
MKKLWIALGLALIALLLSAPLAFAETLSDDKVIFGDNFTLKDGETIGGNLIVLGGSVTIEDGARVTDNLVVFGGNVELGGEVGGDVVTFGGSADLLGSAVVEGRLVTSGGSITRAEGAEVKGGESQGFSFSYDTPLPFLPEPLRPLNPLIALVRDLVLSFAVAVGVAFLALLVVLFLPEQTRRVSAAMTTAPVASGFLGLLTFVAGPVLITLTAITLCLIPVSVLGAVVFAMAVVFGWLALGALIGERLAAALRWHTLGPAVSAALGTFLVTLFVWLFDLLANLGLGGWLFLPIRCVVFVVSVGLASVGLGAVVLTRFGTRAYLGSAPPATSAPSSGMPAHPQSEAAIVSAASSESAPPAADDSLPPNL